MTRTVIVTPSPEISARYEPSGRISEILFTAMSLLSRISDVRALDEGGDPADTVPEPVHQPDLVFREHVREVW